MINASATEIPFVVGPTEGRVIRAFGSELTFHLTSDQTGGRYLLATLISHPGDPGPPLHYHENEDECFVVQEGRMAFYIDGSWREVKPGTMVFAPRMSVHSLKNVGDAPARVLMSASPAGFDKFFGECAVEFAKPGGPDMGKIVEISTAHGIHYV